MRRVSCAEAQAGCNILPLAGHIPRDVRTYGRIKYYTILYDIKYRTWCMMRFYTRTLQLAALGPVMSTCLVSCVCCKEGCLITAELPAWLCACSACTAASVCWQRCGGVTAGMKCRSNVYFSVLVAQGAAQSLLAMVAHVGQLNVCPHLQLFRDCAIPAMRNTSKTAAAQA